MARQVSLLSIGSFAGPTRRQSWIARPLPQSQLRWQRSPILGAAANIKLDATADVRSTRPSRASRGSRPASTSHQDRGAMLTGKPTHSQAGGPNRMAQHQARRGVTAVLVVTSHFTPHHECVREYREALSFDCSPPVFITAALSDPASHRQMPYGGSSRMLLVRIGPEPLLWLSSSKRPLSMGGRFRARAGFKAKRRGQADWMRRAKTPNEQSY
ncbi:hypothetical protein B0T11DRAFT_144219 [Plectosphaerella cucumerina]|uniref:Uncharacterized protein n=1 Tax=Plectosphaerella cucumerina TaxID=40658 RepID=A0A8K0WY46_9PEZI|nr:hypothetical protein B0T11DRAFT_144219 [Plectosphaerella cucumerina]